MGCYCNGRFLGGCEGKGTYHNESFENSFLLLAGARHRRNAKQICPKGWKVGFFVLSHDKNHFPLQRIAVTM
ncbi:hypothetical protein KAI36_02191 [Paenibacillus sp. S02]|nr:hypothetical protein KAI36_02191 [Paenibacillus sp. S02]